MATGANQPLTPDLPPEGPINEDGNFSQGAPDFSQQPAARTVQEDAADRAPAQQWTDDKRSEIFQRARERRLEQTEPFSGDPNDPNALYGSQNDHSELGELEQEALRRQQEALMGQQAPRRPLNNLDPQLLAQTVPIIVDGEQREVTVEEALRDYQINRAADKRLEQAKMLLAQTAEFQRLNARPAAAAEYNEPTGQDDSSSAQGDYEDDGYTSRRPGNAKELVEKIQLGTPEEAQQALEDFISQAVNREAPVDDTTRVLTALEDANSKQAVLQFAQANPQINNPVVQAEATREIQRNMALDLLQAGYTVEQLRELAPSATHLTNLHKQARIQRLPGVRRVEDLMVAGYHGAMSNLRQLVTEQPQQQGQYQGASMQQRQQRKDALQTQPTARRLSPSLAPPSQSRSQDQSRSAAVMNMRKARGQPT
ncbi:MAG TPA: hypothetical protein PKI32_05880 [Opitutales bacterium]|nr:hypothetical protein [Opitutales bacterium]